MAGLQLERFSTRDDVQQPSERAERWSEHVIGNHSGGITCEYEEGIPENFLGRTRIARYGEGQVIAFDSERIRYKRTLRQTKDGNETAHLIVPVTGQVRLAQGGDVATLEPGQPGVKSMRRPSIVEHDFGTTAYILTIPAAYARQLPDRSLVNLSPHGGHLGAVVALTDYLVNAREFLDSASFTDIYSRLNKWIVKSLDQSYDSELRYPPELAGKMRIVENAEVYIKKNYTDEKIDSDNIAAALCISRRQLFAAFESVSEINPSMFTTPIAFLRWIRIEHAKERLRDPSESRTAITRIAYDAGFGSVDAFTRLFAKQCGAPPQKFRRALAG